MRRLFLLGCVLLQLCCLPGCRKIELVMPTEYDLLPFPEDPNVEPARMYLLNEGNMGSNKASIDYVDFRTRMYCRNIYPEKNPTVVKELGDVGNDIQIYRGRIYAVINCSHKVEVMDRRERFTASTCDRTRSSARPSWDSNPRNWRFPAIISS